MSTSKKGEHVMFTSKFLGYHLIATALGGVLLFQATPEVMASPVTSMGPIQGGPVIAKPRDPDLTGAVLSYLTYIGQGAITGAVAGAVGGALLGTPACPAAATAGAIAGASAGAAAFVWDSFFGEMREVTYPADVLD